MKSLFQNNQFEGFAIFSHKNNWKNILTVLREVMLPHKVFFFFDSERGNHLKVFSKHFEASQINAIEHFLATLPQTHEILTEDPLFKNTPENTVHRLQLIPKSIDIFYYNDLSDIDFTDFLCHTSSVVIDALHYNDFFIQEKNRLNFAIQLVFMALVRADKNLIIQNLKNLYTNAGNIGHNTPLLGFFKDVQQIETEDNIENWVLDWLNISEDFLQKNTFQVMVESICQLLEIRSFSHQLFLITIFVLNETNATE